MKNLRVEVIGSETLEKNMEVLTRNVERKVAKLLLNKFRFLFNDWSLADVHYVEIFVTFPRVAQNGCSGVLMGFSLLEN